MSAIYELYNNASILLLVSISVWSVCIGVVIQLHLRIGQPTKNKQGSKQTSLLTKRKIIKKRRFQDRLYWFSIAVVFSPSVGLVTVYVSGLTTKREFWFCMVARSNLENLSITISLSRLVLPAFHLTNIIESSKQYNPIRLLWHYPFRSWFPLFHVLPPAEFLNWRRKQSYF